MHHEAIAVLALQRVDDLLVARGAERRGHQRLGLAAREQRRAVRARQQAGAYRDRAHGARIAAVDARLAVQDLAAHDLRFQREADFLDRVGVRAAFRADPDFGEYALPDVVDRLGAGLLLLDLECRAQIALGEFRDARDQRLVLGRRRPVPRGAPASSTISLIAWITACICWWPNTTAPSITSSGSSFASDSTISTACSVPATTRSSCEVFSSVAVGFSTYWPLTIADARGADRAVERNAGDRERGRGADHRRNVGIDLVVRRHDGRDDLHFVVEAVGKQRADRAVDQPAGQNLLLGGPAFAPEKAAGNLAGGVGAFLVIDGQRQEILARLRPASRRPR